MNEQIHRQKGHSLMAADKTGHMERGGGAREGTRGSAGGNYTTMTSSTKDGADCSSFLLHLQHDVEDVLPACSCRCRNRGC